MVPRKMVIDNIECLQNELDLVDIWRIKNPQLKVTPGAKNRHKFFCRLDYWLVSNNSQDFVNSTDMTPAIKTDHVAIAITLTDSYQNAKGPGFWKMNVSLLDDENYLKDLENKLPQYIEDNRYE